jgi:hypothetical protein
MWTGERGDERPFHGAHVRIERPLNAPRSLAGSASVAASRRRTV